MTTIELSQRVLDTVLAIPLCVANDNDRLTRYVARIDKELQAKTLEVTLSMRKVCQRMGFNPTSTLSFGEVDDWMGKARDLYIQIHHIDYLMSEVILSFLDLIGKKKIKRGNSQRFLRRIEKFYSQHNLCIKNDSQKDSFFCFNDHMQMFAEMLLPRLENFFVAVRDRMIALGKDFTDKHVMKDIEILARYEVARMLTAVDVHSRRSFFKEFTDRCGIDFTKKYAEMDMSPMISLFHSFAEQIGIKEHCDKYGMLVMDGFSYTDSLRCQTAWKQVLNLLRDEDAADEVAMHAMALHPTIKEEYEREREKVVNAEMDEMLGKLETKYNVKKAS